MAELLEIAGWILLAISLLGVVYTIAAGLAVGWFFSRPSAVAGDLPPVTILKPLCGDEPQLRACLDGFCVQDYPAPLQIIFGVRDALDPAISIVRALATDHPEIDIDLVINGRLHGPNFKISNFINMERRARHPFIVLCDSDVSVGGDYLRNLVAPLTSPEVGFVTCAYLGVPTGNFWSRLSAMAIDYHFLPSLAFGLRLGWAKPCLGPTIAFRKSTFDRVGGFARFANFLAEDYEMGRAIRGLGYRFVVPPFAIGHACPERSARGLLDHELRWARTIRMIDPLSYAGSAVCHPLPWAMAAVLLLHASIASLLVLAIVAASRLFVILEVDRVSRGAAGAWWLAPGRDLLSGAIWVAAFFVQTVSWRGQRLRIGREGLLVPHRRTFASAGVHSWRGAFAALGETRRGRGVQSRRA